MAMPAIIGLSSSIVHSSFVKLDLSATIALLETIEAAFDISAVRGLIEKAAADGKTDAADLKKYETDIKPFLVPFDAMFAAGSIDGDLTRSVIYITVK